MVGEKQKQDQHVQDGAHAIQSGRDTNIQNGLSADDMRAIIETVADQLPKYAAIAAQIVEERLKSFEEKIISRFEKDVEAKTEAFKDPDFQYLLRQTQHAYARSGNSNVGDNLAELITERSKAKPQSRIALTLNRAAESVPLLTKNEFAELSLSFLMRQVRFTSIRSVEELGAVLSMFAEPLISSVSKERSSYMYLQSLGCANISFGSLKFERLLANTQTRIFVKNIPKAELSGILTQRTVDSLLQAGIFTVSNTQGDLVSPNFQGFDDFEEALNGAGLDAGIARSSSDVIASHIVDRREIINMLSPFFPRIGHLIDLWNETPLESLELTTVGIAIAHANLKRFSTFNADLGIWIN